MTAPQEIWRLRIAPEWGMVCTSEHGSQFDALLALQRWCDRRDRFAFRMDPHDTEARRTKVTGTLRDMAVAQSSDFRLDEGRECGSWAAVRVPVAGGVVTFARGECTLDQLRSG